MLPDVKEAREKSKKAVSSETERISRYARNDRLSQAVRLRAIGLRTHDGL
jgi:hypothetical protein